MGESEPRASGELPGAQDTLSVHDSTWEFICVAKRSPCCGLGLPSLLWRGRDLSWVSRSPHEMAEPFIF